MKQILFLFLAINFSIGKEHSRKHHRRSLANEHRYVGLTFESEPVRNLSVVGRHQLNCQYQLHDDKHVKDVRLEWRRDSAVVSEKTSDRIKIYSNGTLEISDATSSDDGTYQCAVHVTTLTKDAQTGATDRNIWIFRSRKAQIKTADLGKFEAQPVDRTVAKGQPTALHCLVASRPSPQVTWFLNEKPISAGADYHILPLSNTLEISSTQPRHEGVYKCSVEAAGKRRTSQSGRISVSHDPPSNDLAFVSVPRLQIVHTGEDLLLECLVTSNQRPEVRWLKDSRQIIVDGVRVRRVGVSSLLIKSTTSDDGGLYTCRASNQDDSLDRAVAVEVRWAPHLTTKPASKLAVETADVEMECAASGRPDAKISWFKNGEMIIPSEYFVIEANRLRILGVVKTDQGVYQCLAENEAGTEQAIAQLLVDSPDSSSVAASSGQPLIASSPLGLKTTSVGSRFISIEWDPPVQRNGNVMRYHVYFKESDSDRERTANATGTSITLSSLQPATIYLLRVAAENEAGVGKSSEPLKVTTNKEQAVPGRVTSLAAVPLGPETIEIRWKPPAGGHPPLRYKLFYSKDPPEENEKETLIITSSTVYTLHGMDKYTGYTIRVEAEGENGSGLSSENVKVRTLSDEPGSPPQNIMAEPESSTSIRVTWTEPEADSVNGEITGYRLKFKTKARGSKGNTLVIDASAREYTMGGLEPGSQYLVRMAVVNHNGTGPYSDWLAVDTATQDKEERLLSPPRELRAHAGRDFIVVSWQAPNDETNLVRGYQIGWGVGVPDMKTERVSAAVNQHKIVSLHPSRDYVISLRAYNSQGSGFPIYETVRTLSRDEQQQQQEFGRDGEGAEAGTPVAVKADAVSATSIKVRWTEADQNAFNTQYTVRFSTSIDGNQQRYVNSSETWTTIEGLRPATEYEFSVRSISSGGGFSSWSLATRNKTHAAAPSSAPRDLTVLPAESGDPHSVSLHWQPPKYANGEIEEYLVYYTDRESLADKDWTINYVSGDRLSHQVSNLLPKANYFFKIQARNEKGFGPFSPVQGYTPQGGVLLSSDRGRGSASSPGAAGFDELKRLIFANPLYFVLLVAIGIILILVLVLVLMCCFKRSSPKTGYIAGKKTSASGASGNGGDLWINPSGSHLRAGASDYMVDGLVTAHLTSADVVESPPPRYQHLQGNGTLNRSYHQSSNSLEGRQRTPQVVYTGTGRHQPITKIDYCQSPYGSSSSQIGSATPPLPMGGPPSGPPTVLDGYRTLRGTPPASASAALRSFTQLAGATPPSTSASGGARPVVVATGVRQLPVGRATAQPRVNVANIYSPYASCTSDGESEKKSSISGGHESIELQETPTKRPSPMEQKRERPSILHPSSSTEELNAQMENLDTMIDDLQALQHEFGVAS